MHCFSTDGVSHLSTYNYYVHLYLTHFIHDWLWQQPSSSELKPRKKVSFNIASEASYIFIWSGKKKLGEFLKNLKLAVKQCYYLDKSLFWSKISGKCQKLKCHILNNFQTLCCIREGLLIMGDEDLIHVKHPLAFTNKSSVLLYAVFI